MPVAYFDHVHPLPCVLPPLFGGFYPFLAYDNNNSNYKLTLRFIVCTCVCVYVCVDV